jgi:Fe-S-cluster-containing hydrogenase component 2
MKASIMNAPSRRLSRRALLGLSEPDEPVGRITEACLSKRNIMCESCADACEPRAIQFTRRGTIKIPHLDTARCTACRECVAMCPVDAIVIESPESTEARV